MSNDVITDLKKEEIFQDLNNQLTILVNDVGAINEELRNLDTGGPDTVEQAQAIEERNSLIAKSNHKKISIDAIRNTITNFDDFGLCKDCFGDIEHKRLLNNPTAARCLVCQEIEEIKIKQGRK
ncbi:hypothetical protein [Psychromonas sp. SP041]|uniref:TraR/DksA family transcriptional regulator n=1 Tax=Psychromonas sp. SP041 TaxID=1365007 RepID=UPI0010C79591|nr:hypothetical protein [Psychromonas sp. SP041]